MKGARISLIAALGKETGSIGRGNRLLWRLKEDLARFKNLTLGHVVIMGRKTYESIGKTLPDRTNIIITRNKDYKVDNALIAGSLDEAISKGADIDSEIFVIGGGEIYKEAIGLADKLYLTLVESPDQGDVRFPDWTGFGKIVKEEERTDLKTGLKFTWLDIEK